MWSKVLALPRLLFQLLVVVSQSLSCVWLWPHGLQHIRLPCLLLSPWVCLNSYPLCWWRCLTISSSAGLFYLCLQSSPASGSFPVSQLFESGGQSNGTSASVYSVNTWGWFPLGLTGLILRAKGLSRVFSSTTIQKHQFFDTWPSLWSNSHIQESFWLILYDCSYILCWFIEDN